MLLRYFQIFRGFGLCVAVTAAAASGAQTHAALPTSVRLAAHAASGAPAATSLPALAVRPHRSAVTLTVASATTPTGNAVTLVAVVSGAPNAKPVGSVTFTAQGKPLGTAAMQNGRAQLTISNLPLGATTLLASYPGDEHLMPSQSAPVNLYLDPDDPGL